MLATVATQTPRNSRLRRGVGGRGELRQKQKDEEGENDPGHAFTLGGWDGAGYSGNIRHESVTREGFR